MVGEDQTDKDALTTLRRRLHTLLHDTSTVEEGARLLAPGPDAGHLEALKAEVSETQMPRLLIFSNDREEVLSLEVSGGRVLRGAEPSTAELVTQHAPMGAFLAGRRGDDHAAIMNVIRSFCAKTRSVRVKVDYLCGGPEKLTHGFDLAPLEPLMDDDERPDGSQQQIELIADFTNRCKGLVDAGVCWDKGSIVVQFGDNARTGLLTKLAATEGGDGSDDMDADAYQSATAHFVVYAGPPEVGRSVLCATRGSAIGMLSFDHDGLAPVLDIWKSLTR